MDAGEPAASTPAADPAAPGPPVRSSPFRGRSAILAFVVVVAVIVVVGALYATGAISHSSGPSGPSAHGPTPVTYFQARNVSAARAGSEPGGPWELEMALGIDANASQSAPIGNLSWAFGCAVTGLNGSSNTATVPSFSGNASSGLAPWWAFLYQSPSGSGALLVQVSGGSSVAAALTGTCEATARVRLAISPDVVNSPTVAASAWNQTGGSYVHEHPNATVELALSPMSETLGGAGYTAASAGVWAVAYSGCNALGTAGNVSQEVSGTRLNSTTGALIDRFSGSSGCGPATEPVPGFFGYAFQPGNATLETCPSSADEGTAPGQAGGCVSGDVTVTVSLQASLVTLGSVGVEVGNCTVNDLGSECAYVTVDPGPGAICVLNASGVVVASTSIASGILVTASAGWEFFGTGDSNATPLASTDSIVVDLGQPPPFPGTEVQVTFQGLNAYDGSQDVSAA